MVPFKFGKCANQYLGTFCYLFNHRQMVSDLIAHGPASAPVRERYIRGVAEVHD